MLIRLKLLITTLSGSALLMLLLCLGAQNLSSKQSLNLGFDKTVELPTGFIIGVSVVLGFMSGGSTAAIILPSEEKKVPN